MDKSEGYQLKFLNHWQALNIKMKASAGWLFTIISARIVVW
jgi:hypothetical protein